MAVMADALRRSLAATVGVLTVLGALIVDPAAGEAADNKKLTLREAYSRIEHFADRIDAPKPVGSATVGRYDEDTGKFTGARTVVTHTPPDKNDPKPRTNRDVPDLDMASAPGSSSSSKTMTSAV